MSALKEAFTKLVDARFIKRSAELVDESNQEPNGNKKGKATKIPALVVSERTMYSVPNITIPGSINNFLNILSRY